MKRILTACLCMFVMQAHAEWADNDITDIIDNVKNVKSTVQGNVATTANDLKRQLDDLKARGVHIASSVEEILVWLNHRQDRFDAFKGSSCGSGSPCADFRRRLKRFAGDMSALTDRFPAIEKVGLGDGAFAEDAIEILPPFVLFGFQQVMDKVAGWEDIPLDLLDVFDEIADPEAFSVSFSEPSSATRQSASTSQATAQLTPTQRFCEKRAYRVDNPTDSIRLNRIKSAGFALKTAVDIWSEFAPDKVGGSLVGEGVYGIPIFAKPIVKAIKGAIEIIQFQLETYRQNLGVCRDRLREIETHLASCVHFAEYRQQPANDEVYSFVEKKIEEFGSPLRSRARHYLDAAKSNRDKQLWGLAYDDLCRSYLALGSSY
jgi:hypothetical protein